MKDISWEVEANRCSGTGSQPVRTGWEGVLPEKCLEPVRCLPSRDLKKYVATFLEDYDGFLPSCAFSCSSVRSRSLSGRNAIQVSMNWNVISLVTFVASCFFFTSPRS